jgi:hypothetical protein
MQSFLKVSPLEPEKQPSSIYCQQDEKIMQMFACLMIYPLGVPNEKFSILVSYSYQ